MTCLLEIALLPNHESFGFWVVNYMHQPCDPECLNPFEGIGPQSSHHSSNKDACSLTTKHGLLEKPPCNYWLVNFNHIEKY